MSPLDNVLEEPYDSEVESDVALYLLNHGSGSDENKAKLLCRACYWGELDVVKELVEQHKVDPNGEIVVACSVYYTCELSCLLLHDESTKTLFYVLHN